jgi:hypothetical protein
MTGVVGAFGPTQTIERERAHFVGCNHG